MPMHYAKYAHSKRQQRVIGLLLDGREHSTREIMRRCHVCAVNSIVCELRRNGFPIPSPRRSAGVYFYRLGA